MPNVLVAELDGQRIDAWHAERGPTYFCPKCSGIVVLKHGRKVIAHFAHKPPTDCTWAAGETRDHLLAKRIVRDEFVSRGLRAEAEFIVNALPRDRRTDVMVWSPRGNRIAFELQHTSIDLDELEARAGTYAREGIAQIWIPFVRASVWKEGEHKGADRYFVERYSPRPLEKWIHGFYGKAGMWMFDPRGPAFWRAALTGHQIYVEESNWFEDGQEMWAGGFYRWSKRYRELTLHGPFELHDLRVQIIRRRAGGVPGYRWPAAQLATLVELPAHPKSR